MKLLVRWLQSTFPKAFAPTTDDSDDKAHILDVAGGGKGELATRLAWCCQQRVVIVDPRCPADLAKCLEKVVLPQLPKKWQQAAVAKAAANDTFSSYATQKLNKLVTQHAMYFTHKNALSFLFSSASDRLQKEHTILNEAIEKASLLIGMHADSATEAIVDAALHHHKPFVVVPCCVFPNLFPQRRVAVKLHDNNPRDTLEPYSQPFTSVPVRSYEQFCAYLLEKDPRLQSAVLPFPGRNLAIYWDGG